MKKKEWTATRLKEPWNGIVLMVGGLALGQIIGRVIVEYFTKHHR